MASQVGRGGVVHQHVGLAGNLQIDQGTLWNRGQHPNLRSRDQRAVPIVLVAIDKDEEIFLAHL